MSSKPRYYDQAGGSKINYSINPNAMNIQITIGGRSTGSVTLRDRPYLAAHPVLGIKDIADYADTEFEIPPNNVINLATRPQQTFSLSGKRTSAIQIDDTGNGVNDIWVHISEW